MNCFGSTVVYQILCYLHEKFHKIWLWSFEWECHYFLIIYQFTCCGFCSETNHNCQSKYWANSSNCSVTYLYPNFARDFVFLKNIIISMLKSLINTNPKPWNAKERGKGRIRVIITSLVVGINLMVRGAFLRDLEPI